MWWVRGGKPLSCASMGRGRCIWLRPCLREGEIRDDQNVLACGSRDVWVASSADSSENGGGQRTWRGERSRQSRRWFGEGWALRASGSKFKLPARPRDLKLPATKPAASRQSAAEGREAANRTALRLWARAQTARARTRELDPGPLLRRGRALAKADRTNVRGAAVGIADAHCIRTRRLRDAMACPRSYQNGGPGCTASAGALRPNGCDWATRQ